MTATISAEQVRILRERTGVGLMACKKALASVGGDLEAAVDVLRKSGAAAADKKSACVVTEGVIRVVQQGDLALIVEISCQTDFVARDANFVAFCDAVVALLIANPALRTLPALEQATVRYGEETVTVEAARQALVLKIGENVQIRRWEYVTIPSDCHLGLYNHGGRIGVLLLLQGGDPELAKGLAMHIAAAHPEVLRAEDMPATVLEREHAVYTAQAEQTGKPAAIVEQMVAGRMRKFLEEKSLLGQIYVIDNPDGLSVEKILRNHQATALTFFRYQVGEGIEKKTENFAQEVMAQVKGH